LTQFDLANYAEKANVMIMTSPPSVFIFGLGFTGSRLAQMLVKRGWSVRGTRRAPETPMPKGQELPDHVEVFRFSAGEPIDNPDHAFDGITHVVSTIAVIGGSDPVLAAHGEALAQTGAWAGYVSATSVYTEADGGWVTEESEAKPISRRGQLRRQAEQDWQDMMQAEVFRAAGIYGAGRSAFQSLLSGKARIIRKPGHLFNRIHVIDLARIIMTAMETPSPRRILNCADGHAAEAGEVVRAAAAMLGVDAPPAVDFADAEMSEMARSFYATARCVNSQRLKTALHLDLLYPDYHTGLAAVLEEERQLGLISER
jgi:nucleoside-diphosphate-sugar epimerase